MKTRSIRSILAVIQLVGLLLIAMSFLGPRLWRGQYSDLEGSIVHGGEIARAQYRQTVAKTASRVTTCGAGFGVVILVLASVGAMLCRKSEVV